MLDKLKDLDLRYEDLESQLGDPRVYGDAEKLRQVNRELKELLPVVETYRAYQAADSRRREAEELLHDPEMKEMAQDELAEAKEELEHLKEKLTNKIYHFLMKLNIDNVRTPQRMLWSSLLIFSFIR